MAETYRVRSPIVRVAGLPVGTLADLRFDKTDALVEELLAHDAWLAAEATALGDLLYQAIGALAVPSLKPRLVGLRRSVHSGRRPRPQEWGDEVARTLPVPVAERVRDWVGALAEQAARVAELPAVLAEETASRTGVLRSIVAAQRFRHGLAHSSPALSDELDRWLAGGRPDRQVLARLTRYVSRAATKTSPYSTFTSTGTGRWRDGDGPALRLRADVPEHGLLDLHGATVPALERALAARPELRGALRVRVNPSAVERDGRWWFLGPPPTEPVLALGATAEVARCHDAVGAGCTFAELCERLAGDAIDPERIAAFIDRLVELGLLEARIPVPDQCADPLGTLAEWLESVGGKAFTALARACRELGAEVARPSTPEEYAAHRDRLRAIQRRVGAVGTLAGLDWTAIAAAPVGAVHENAVYGGEVADLSRDRWRPALDDLAALRPWLGAQDPGRPLRAALGPYVRERFGPGATVALVHLQHALASHPLHPDPVVHHDLPSAADGTIQLDPETLGTGPGPDSVTCFVQPWPRDGELRLVLNTVFAGPGRGSSRWLRLVRRAGATVPAEPPDGSIVEVSGLFGLPFNARLPVAAYEIEYPYTVSERPAAQRIPLADLVVVHDPATDTVRLRSARLDREVRPVHTGLQAELLLPPVLQLLVRGFGPNPTLLHTARPLFSPVPAGTVPDAVTALPRVDAGRITLQRAAWLAPYPLVPLRTKGETDAAYLLRLRGWLRGHGIPQRCFVQAITVRGRPVMSKARKPLYVDFANWFLCTVFERLLHQPADLVVFREALPAPEDATGRAPGDARVTEVMVELSGDG
jgi:lantibiotic biosynthesis dehydratase-like protein